MLNFEPKYDISFAINEICSHLRINGFGDSFDSKYFNVKHLLKIKLLSYSDQKICNDLFNINRSLAGKENRKSLQILKKYIKNLKIKYFYSGEKIGDWIIPKEWNVTSAYIKDENGNTLIDYKSNFLHLASYSSAFKGFVDAKYLKTKIYTSNKINDAIPYKTFYYSKD